MASSFTNIHLRTDDVDAVRKALDGAEITQSKMFGRTGTLWVSVYPRATEDGDFSLLKAYAFALSRHAEKLALAVMVQESINLRFVLYENGSLLEEYALHPAYPDLSKSPTIGSLDTLLPFCIDGTTRKDLEILLTPAKKDKVQRDAESLAHGLAHFLGVPRAQISMGFNDLKEAQAGR